MPQIYAKPVIIPPYPKPRDGHCGMCGERPTGTAYLGKVRVAGPIAELLAEARVQFSSEADFISWTEQNFGLNFQNRGWPTRRVRALICQDCAGPLDALGDVDEEYPAIECPGCGLTFRRYKSYRGRRLVFDYEGVQYGVAYCSAACGAKARRKAKRIKNRQCVVCKQKFKSPRRDAQYCSGACRQQRYRVAHSQP